MSLAEEQVKHVVFGLGRVKSVEDGRITIVFSEGIGQKAFRYPDAFEKHLEMCEPAAQRIVGQDLSELMVRMAAERLERARIYHEEQAVLSAERKAAVKTPKRKTAPKSAEKAVKKTADKAAAEKKVVDKKVKKVGTALVRKVGERKPDGMVTEVVAEID